MLETDIAIPMPRTTCPSIGPYGNTKLLVLLILLRNPSDCASGAANHRIPSNFLLVVTRFHRIIQLSPQHQMLPTLDLGVRADTCTIFSSTYTGAPVPLPRPGNMACTLLYLAWILATTEQSMKSKRIVQSSLTLVALAMSALVVHAQQPQGSGPIGPIGPLPDRQLPVPAGRTPDGTVSSKVQADTHTLASIETLGVGSLGTITNFLDPGFTFSQSGGSGLATVPQGTSQSLTSIGVDATFDKTWGQSSLTGFYRGSQLLYYPDSAANSFYHNAGVAQEFRWGRWVLRLRDDLLISPDASFGGIAIGGLTISPQGYMNNLQPGATGGDTILTPYTRRVRNIGSGEVNYFLSRRSIVTFAGSYTSMTFKAPGYINTYSLSGRAGYDYRLTPKDTVGVIYESVRTRFSIPAPHMQTDSIQLAFGRRVTGRLALQFAGGPQHVGFGVDGLGVGGNVLTWTFSSAADYQTRRTQYLLTYTHSSSAGSGLFVGSNNHTISGGIRYTLTRWWYGSAGGGYAFNDNLTPGVGPVGRFNNSYGTAALERVVGPHMHLSFGYGIQRQTAPAGACPASGCGFTALRQTGSVTLAWHPWSIGAR
jgi:hypothetical protein